MTWVQGLLGVALGVAAGAFSFWGLQAAVALMTAPFEEPTGMSPRAAKRKTWILALTFLMKLPVFVGLGLAAVKIGGPGPYCFALGVVSVYSAAIMRVFLLR